MDYQEYQIKQPLTEQPKKQIGKKTFLSVLILLILVVVGWFLYENLREKPVISNTLSESYKFTVMAKDQYPTGFPENVVVKEGNPIWQRGEDTTTGDGQRLKIVELIYAKTEPAILVSSFEGTFKSEAWLIDEKQNNDTPIVRVFNKTKEGVSETATLIIIKINEVDSLVNITLTTP